MAQKLSPPWRPRPQGHINAGAILSRKASMSGKSGATVQRKLASFRAAAKIAKLTTVNSMTPQAPSPTPQVTPVIQPLASAPRPPKLPTTPSGGTS